MQEGNTAFFPLGWRRLAGLFSLGNRPPGRLLECRRPPLFSLALALLALGAAPPVSAQRAAPLPSACTRASGLTLPEGFCAVMVAEHLGRVRQIAVAPQRGCLRRPGGRRGRHRGAARHRWRREADRRQCFGDEGGTGIGYHEGYLWFAPTAGCSAGAGRSGDLVPRGSPEVVVDGLPTGGHAAKTLRLSRRRHADREHRLRDQQLPARRPQRPLARATTPAPSSRSAPASGASPPTQLRPAAPRTASASPPGCATRSPWRSTPAPGGCSPRRTAGTSWAQNWGYTDAQNAELPAEEFLRGGAGGRLRLALLLLRLAAAQARFSPRSTGATAQPSAAAPRRRTPLIGFPGHWAPMAIAFYDGTQFPARYRGGAFVAFHGSWNRAPLPQQGYRVVFVPFGPDGQPAGEYETFATSARGRDPASAGGRRGGARWFAVYWR